MCRNRNRDVNIKLEKGWKREKRDSEEQRLLYLSTSFLLSLRSVGSVPARLCVVCLVAKRDEAARRKRSDRLLNNIEIIIISLSQINTVYNCIAIFK